MALQWKDYAILANVWDSVLTALRVTGTLTAGTALIGKVGIDQTTPGTTNAVADLAPANQATGQVTATTSAATMVIARATRKSVLIRNTDAAISVYIGPATVSAVNGMLLKAGESVPVDTTALIQVIAASGTPVVSYYDAWY